VVSKARATDLLTAAEYVSFKRQVHLPLAMSAKEYFQNDFIEYADQELDRIADRIERAIAPVHEAHFEWERPV
jgi:hypothetical protein